ncbi:hypothetical protein [Salidesulfovibrio onnuriiensis]|uniref:hypothetical protein n=1 Tax=Salidesulfovibrio onnuriiensis TaxID=2583823 RepID=UPI0011CA34CF|nr:hypothetical protein [Salidesulfovibrio onnuriiensis]
MDSKNPSQEDFEAQKKVIYEKMSARRRKFVDRMGYENWDPFAKPFDPIDIRTDATGHTAHQLTHLFMASMEKQPNQEYLDAINEFNVMLVMNFEKVRPLYDYCLWYEKYCKSKGITP